MATANTISTLNGFFKETYAKDLQNLIPDQVKLVNMIKFLSKDKQPGGSYHQPVILGQEHGVTLGASDDDAFTLNPAIAGAVKDATIKGCPAILRSVLGYSAAARAAQGDKQAFMNGTKFLFANMLRSMAKKIEIELLYGQVGYGTVNANTTAATSFVVALADWAPGIWAGAEGLSIDVRNPAGNTLRGNVSVVSVDMTTRTITVDSALTLTAGDVIWTKGGFGKGMVGIHKMLTQTSGTLFGIDVSYNLFRGNTYDAASGPLTRAKLSAAVCKAVEKGLDGKLVAMVNPKAWANLNNEAAALRMYDSSYSSKRADQGAEKLVYHSENGEIEIISSIYVKEGYAYLLNIEDFVRVGSQDVSFNRPGGGENVFLELADIGGFELRLFTDQAIFCSSPGKSVVITGIVNS
jgi:hypothetical protein